MDHTKVERQQVVEEAGAVAAFDRDGPGTLPVFFLSLSRSHSIPPFHSLSPSLSLSLSLSLVNRAVQEFDRDRPGTLALPYFKGTPLNILKTFTSKQRPERGLDCLICATFARHRPMIETAQTRPPPPGCERIGHI